MNNYLVATTTIVTILSVCICAFCLHLWMSNIPDSKYGVGEVVCLGDYKGTVVDSLGETYTLVNTYGDLFSVSRRLSVHLKRCGSSVDQEVSTYE